MDIPCIDLTWEKDKILTALQESLETVGFFKIKNHNVNIDLITSLFKVSKDFFSLSPESKNSVKVTTEHPYGYEKSEILSYTYNSEGTKPDPKETYNMNLYNNPLWPVDNNSPGDLTEFKTTLTDYFLTLEQLGMLLIGLFEEVLQLTPGRLTDLYKPINGPSMLSLRLIKYSELCSDDEVIRGTEHTDYGVLTILAQDDIGGLQVSHKGVWCDVRPDPETFVINIGDMMMRMTNDRWKSTLHRVVGRRSPVRYSTVMFFSPNEDAVIEALKSADKARYEPIRSKEYILSKFYITAPKIK